ncbi:MAG: hypothetical protein U0169_16040 [Polyangiaceae bacterium]
MSPDELEKVVTHSAAAQKTVERIPVVIAMVFGVGILALAIFVPAKSGEEAAKLAMVVAAIAGIVGGILYARFSASRLARFTELVLRNKGEIRERTLVHLRRRGVTHYQVGLVDADGRKYRVTMPSQAIAIAVLESTTKG